MCGIAGIYNITGEPADAQLLARLAETIAHRGPDGQRIFTEGGLGLAHRHLRIIDLSDAAMQPMTNEDGSLQLIFNGEIYNYIEMRPQLEVKGHKFASHSDTETLLHAYEEWGLNCLPRFNGMFAFALWDSRRKRLFIARDRLGVKPLYYWWDGRTLVFGSEIKALLAHPQIEARPHIPAITEYMSAMYTIGEHTWFKGIKRLLPGHFMLVQPDGLRVERWWDVPDAEEELGTRPEKSYVQTTRKLLEDSVRLRLRSDVPLGAHLSGGIDSSAIVALLSKQLAPTGEPVRTFSGAFREGSAYDERRYVRTVVRRYGTDHRETLPCAQDLPTLLDKMVWHMDEPSAGPGILLQWAVCKLSREAGVTVVNGGQGGDEAWAGYFGYIPSYLGTLMQQMRKHPSLLGDVASASLRLLGRESTRSSLMRAIESGRSGRLRATSDVGEWAGERAVEEKQINLPGKPTQQAGWTPLAAATYWDTAWYLPSLLQVEDRTSMAFSLESRAPLLDYRIIEHAATVPSALKMKGLTTKHILREAVRDLLPTSIYRRTDKMGMPTPIAPWFRGALAPWINSQLLQETSKLSGLISTTYIQHAISEHRTGKRDRSIDIWKALNVEAWWRVFISSR